VLKALPVQWAHVPSLRREMAEAKPAPAKRAGLLQEALTSLFHYVEGSVSHLNPLTLQEQNLYFSV